jgi:hypothetical protein
MQMQMQAAAGAGKQSRAGDDLKVLSKALDLLSAPHPDSDKELLELVKKAKRDADKEDAAAKRSAAAPGLPFLPIIPHAPLCVCLCM